MKKIKFILSLTIFSVLFSCNDYLDINQNPNKELYSNLTPNELLSAAQTNTYRTQTRSMNELGNVYMNAWSPNVAQVGGGYVNELKLSLNTSFRNEIWNGLYVGINNFQRIIDFPNTNGKYDNYVAIAKICKAHYMQYIVDLYGDAPYTEAFKSPVNLTPKFNDDQFIYRQLISELESARKIISDANPNADVVTTEDTMLAGSMSDWVSFANTIELRMLLRMSNNTGAVASYRDEKINALKLEMTAKGTSFMLSDVAINPGYGKGSNDQQNPFFNFIATDIGGNTVFNFGFIATSGHAFKCLNLDSAYAAGTNNSIILSGTLNYPNVNDARRTRLWRVNTGAVRGVTQGSSTVDVWGASGSGLPGRACGSGLLNPYLLQPPVFSDYMLSSGYVMTKAESFFLQAEALLRGYNIVSPGTAVSNYESGIDASFEYLGLTSNSTAYKAAINPKLGFSMTAPTATSFNDKLQGLMYQKWVALMGIHGIESFIDYNRTGFPITPLPTIADKPNKPKRLMYSSTEISANGPNVPVMNQDDCFIVNKFSPFWMQGNPELGN